MVWAHGSGPWFGSWFGAIVGGKGWGEGGKNGCHGWGTPVGALVGWLRIEVLQFVTILGQKQDGNGWMVNFPGTEIRAIINLGRFMSLYSLI